MKVFTVFAILLILVSFPVLAGGEQEEPPMMDGGMMEASDEMMDGDMEGGLPYMEFKDADHAMMLAEEKPTVLFFAASWCPSCKSAKMDFEENGAMLKDVNLVLVDYDHSADLQKKYGVTYQHTFVQIDPEGEALTVWNGGGTSELLNNIVKEM